MIVLSKDIDRAVAILTDRIDNHTDWLGYAKKTDYTGDAGGVEHHRECLDEYNFMLRLFDDIKKERAGK